MNATRFVGLRGTKSRLFLYIGALLFLGLVVYMYHGCQIHVEDLRQKSEKCQQQQESLSAQLQVIFEYKLRLEKSLQQEKNEHQQTKEDLQSKALEEKTVKDKTILESMNKYTSLQQQHKLLKSQHDDLDEECNKVRISQLQGLEERSRLETQLRAIQQELEQIHAARDKKLEDLKSQYMQLEVELERLSKLYKDQSSKAQQSTNTINYLQKQNNQLGRELTESKDKLKTCQREVPKVVPDSPASKTSPRTTASGVRDPLPGLNVVAKPDKDAADKAVPKSTTPQVNPEAIDSLNRASASANGGVNGGANSNVVPMPPPAAPRKESVALPAGVVPAPLGYADNMFQSNNKNEVNDNGNGWDWNYRKSPNRPGDNNQHDNLLRFQYLNNQRDLNNQRNLNDQHNLNNPQHADAKDLNNHIDSNNHVDLNNRMDLHNRMDFNNAANDPRNVALNAAHEEMLRRNAADMAADLRPQLQRALRVDKHPLPRHHAQNAYAYHAEYEKEGQRNNDLHMEEAEEEGDDDVDQLDYANDGAAKQDHHNDNNNNVMDRKRLDEQRDGVMVNPK